MPWYKKPQFTALKPKPRQQPSGHHRVPDGLWHRCPACLSIIYSRDFEANMRVCHQCDFHEKISSIQRIEMLCDEGSFEEFDVDISAVDTLGFVDSKPYDGRLKATRKKTKLVDAVRCGIGSIGGQQVSLAVMDFGFIGGSMGSVVGEKVTRSIERAIDLKIPVITIVSSGGARMQESTYSLMQMAKTSAALAKMDDARLPHFTILTNPSTAGVMASYGSLGDVIIGEPNALIGFAGPRVIEQTIRQVLPRGFQKSDFVREHGFLDMVVHRLEMRETLAKLLGMVRGPEQVGLDGVDAVPEAPAAAKKSAAKKPAAKKAAKRKSAAKKPAKKAAAKSKPAKKTSKKAAKKTAKKTAKRAAKRK